MTGAGLDWLEPDWPVSARVRVVSTTRSGGVSAGAYAELNLARHVGDHPEAVAENRRRVAEAAQLPAEPLWLEQVHGTDVTCHAGRTDPIRADAAVAFEGGRVCAVMTADCLPVVLADRTGTRVGVAHAGWRGLRAGVLEATVRSLQGSAGELVAWLGPAIGADAFEVGEEVRAAFVEQDSGAARCFVRNQRDRYQADLPGLARLALARAGVETVLGSPPCTYRDRERFFSFRRDGMTGRMATLAWLA